MPIPLQGLLGPSPMSWVCGRVEGASPRLPPSQLYSQTTSLAAVNWDSGHKHLLEWVAPPIIALNCCRFYCKVVLQCYHILFFPQGWSWFMFFPVTSCITFQPIVSFPVCLSLLFSTPLTIPPNFLYTVFPS